MLAMAQTPPAGGTRSDAGESRSPGGLGNPSTLILIVLAVAAFLWFRNRNRALEERLLRQRQERLVEAEQSAYQVANVMRQVPPGAAGAAAREGLASAAPPPAPAVSDDQDQTRMVERAEGEAEAERAAAARAQLAAREAETAGSSEARRSAAAEAAAQEASADTADALRAAREAEERTALAPAIGLEDGGAVPAGAVAGDGTATCPPAYPIKGNASSRIYHEPGQSSYGPTIAEYCFASAGAAEAAGFRQSRARRQREQK
jgi:hypothetical protein